MQFIVLSLIIEDSLAILLDGRRCSRDSLTHEILLSLSTVEREITQNAK